MNDVSPAVLAAVYAFIVAQMMFNSSNIKLSSLFVQHAAQLPVDLFMFGDMMQKLGNPRLNFQAVWPLSVTAVVRLGGAC